MSSSLSCNIVVYDRALGRGLAAVVRAGGGRAEVYRHGEIPILCQDVLKVDLWLIQTVRFEGGRFFNSGFHLGRQLAAGGRRGLLLFTLAKPARLPDSGSCWRTLTVNLDLAAVVRDAVAAPPSGTDDYDKLEKIWPALGPRKLCHD